MALARMLNIGIVATALAAAPAQARQAVDPLDMVDREEPPPDLRDVRTFTYGRSSEERVELIFGPRREGAPLLIWAPGPRIVELVKHETKWLPSFLNKQGWVQATIEYPGRTIVPADALLAHAARAIAEIRNRAQRYGYDGSRIVLVGDGWGAFTAALLATHPDHLAQAGVDIGSIKAVVLIEPSGLDFPREKALASAPRRKELARLAPGGAAAEKRLSPRHQLAPPNAPRFLLMPVKQDEKGMAKAREFESALKAAGVDVDLHPVNRSQEHNLPSYLGFPTNPNNEVLNRFLAPVMVRAP